MAWYPKTVRVEMNELPDSPVSATTAHWHRYIYEEAPVGFFAVGADGRIRMVNPYGAELLGYEPSELVGRSVIDLYANAPAGKAKAREVRARFLVGEVIRGEDLQMRRKGASPIWISLWSRAIRDSAGGIVESRSVIVDISKRKEAEEQLQRSLVTARRAEQARRQLLRHLVRAQEEERRRLASDLHDDPIQVLAAVAIGLELMRRDSQDESQRRRLTELEQTVRGCVVRLRRLAFELRPLGSDRLTLVQAMRGSLESIGREAGFRYRLEDRLASDPDPETSTVAFRITQEALTNIRKHARAHEVHVVVENTGGGVLVRIADDGRGFPIDEAADVPWDHFGLSLIQERAEMAGGWVRARSTPGEGTTFEFWLPTGQPGRRTRRSE